MFPCLLASFSFALSFAISASAASTKHTFRSQTVADGSLAYVKNSGICETTSGVGQVSGYINLTKNASLWFWFFEARSSPDSAPLTLWLNGGPGCSALLGLFQEHGPCTVNADGKTTRLNPYSWNNSSNMIYIDQPFGAGFSTGSGVDDTDAAARTMWTAFQILFESDEFAAFRSRDLIFATESYGAHFGPVFITYFNEQNALIDNGSLAGHKVIFKSLMINDGKHDPIIQYQSLLDFVADAPGYGQLQTTSTINSMSAAWSGTAGCLSQLQGCYAGGKERTDDQICTAANQACMTGLFYPAIRGRDSDDLRQTSNTLSPFPPTYYKNFLGLLETREAIGAASKFDACSNSVQSAFNASGEFGRTALPPLAALANAKFPILIWVGDADIKANWVGVHRAMVSMSWYGNLTLNNTALTNWTIDGTVVAQVKSVDNFTFSRVFGAGHNLPAFVPKTALQFFTRVVQDVSGGESNGSRPGSQPSGKNEAILHRPHAFWSMASFLLLLMIF
ncbi:Alpha/beta-hydrolase [Mycena indigotica]|uniref:Alpha/beta-hydrolase n=1 Tax=Mycena indigotica TaxID=2126181 RepID=A0A8H6S3X9_9AGAR|nr:Alpha/beta-hydrolase [Mycena indigotica]KAF7291863.1 Alpha/beta-hydrolase [Mycena indigotica]